MSGDLLGGALSLGSGLLQSGAAEDAAGAQAAGAQQASAALQRAIEQFAIPKVEEAVKQGRTDITGGLQQSTRTSAPYSLAGLQALDAYQRTLGIAAPKQGSFYLQTALNKGEEQKQALAKFTSGGGLKELGMEGINFLHQGQHPNLDKYRALSIGLFNSKDPAQVMHGLVGLRNNIRENTSLYGTDDYDAGAVQWADELDARIAELNNRVPPDLLTADQKSLLEQYNAGISPSETSDEARTKSLQGFFNNPEYQLLFGGSGAQVDPNASVLDRFQTSPGYQFRLQEGTNALQKSAAAKGLLESGSLQRELVNFGQGLASQEFNMYSDRLTNTFGNYQKNLAALAGLGGSFLGQQSGNEFAAGGALANTSLSGAANIASLYSALGAGQANAAMAAGNANASGILGSGNALAGGLSGFGSALGNFFGGQQRPSGF